MSQSMTGTTAASRGAVRLSAAIMTHPSRLARAVALRDRHPQLDLRVLVDPEPDGPPSALRSARLAWAAVDGSATHHLVLQDDAVLGTDCPGRLAALLSRRPDDAVCLFTEWGSATSFAVRLAALSGAGLAEVVDHYAPTVAAVLPAGLARDFGAQPLGDVPQDDVALRTFLLRRGVSAYVPVPNLVDHDPGVSLTGNDFMGARRAACLADPPGTDVDTAVRPQTLPFFSWIEGRALCNVREDPAGAAWRRELPQWFFTRHGIDMAAAVAAGKDAVRPLARGAVPPVLLFGLWMTAYCLGVEAARLVGAERVEAALSGPVAAAALHTMPWGTLRRFVGADDLVLGGPALRDLLDDGVRHGIGGGR
jgi:hypothetical protein